jgi:hypothetical protein
VVDQNGERLTGIQLMLMDPVFDRMVQRRVTDSQGKYQFVVPEGKYAIRIESVGWDLVKNDKKAYQGQEIVVSGSKPKLIAMKVVVKKSG